MNTKSIIGVMLLFAAVFSVLFSDNTSSKRREIKKYVYAESNPGASFSSSQATNGTNAYGTNNTGTNAIGGTNSTGGTNAPAGNYGNGTNLSDEESNARAAQAVRDGLMGSKSQSKCARGATRILNYYVNGTFRAYSGADAHQMGGILTSEYGMSRAADNGTYKNGDVHILTNSGVGHMEVYMNGQWFSDFPQNGSLYNNGRYATSTLYRLP